jgi:Ca2+-binding EF-hand superfamily protein
MNTLPTCLIIAALVPCGAIADDDLPARSTRDVQVVFQSLDRNRDQQISRTEATMKGSVRKRFDGIDADGDGYLSKAEFSARPTDERFE